MTDDINTIHNTPHNIDAPPIRSQREALTLMLHYLGMAARYFECTPEDTALCKAEIVATLDDHGSRAALVWFDEMEATFEK